VSSAGAIPSETRSEMKETAGDVDNGNESYPLSRRSLAQDYFLSLRRWLLRAHYRCRMWSRGQSTIPSDGVAHQVSVAVLSFDSKVTHVCCPKIEAGVYVLAVPSQEHE